MNLSDGIEASESPVFATDEDGALIVVADDAGDAGTPESSETSTESAADEETGLGARAHDDQG